MSKQTAVEWFMEELRQLAHNHNYHLGLGDIRITQGMLDEFYNQAKQMEKEQMKEAHLIADHHPRGYEFDKWYNETYGGKDEQS